MKRREVFSNLGLGALGVIALPAWANGWSGASIKKDTLQLSLADARLLDDLTETIMPETQTPGAKSLEIAKFVKLMVADVFSPEDRERFTKSLAKVEDVTKMLYGITFAECSTAQRLHLLQGLNLSSDKDQKWFFSTTKRLTVQAYTSSEYFLTNIAKFEFAPGRYLGCVPVTQ
ncbi:MAG TPA: gluconate 2-dehydrogenase subunit 3 family protein [Leadbetterella sp.]|nr:gluconate 2-dehydrogenase subunit 3 family protein [Leadbetterella sp.]